MDVMAAPDTKSRPRERVSEDQALLTKLILNSCFSQDFCRSDCTFFQRKLVDKHRIEVWKTSFKNMEKGGSGFFRPISVIFRPISAIFRLNFFHIFLVFFGK